MTTEQTQAHDTGHTAEPLGLKFTAELGLSAVENRIAAERWRRALLFSRLTEACRIFQAVKWLR